MFYLFYLFRRLRLNERLEVVRERLLARISLTQPCTHCLFFFFFSTNNEQPPRVRAAAVN